MATKDAKFTMVMTTEERKKLDRIAKTLLVSAATVIRVFIHQEYERLFEDPPHRKVPRKTGQR